MAFPPDCGKRFEHLLRSPDGEVGITDPCGGILCSGTDRERALERANEVAALIESAWNQVMDAENERQAWPVTEEFEQAYTDWLARYEDIPNHLITLQLEPHIDEVWSVVADGTCILDALDLAAQSYEQSGVPLPDVPDPPPPEPSIPQQIGGGIKLMLALLGVGLAIAAISRFKK